MVDRALAKSPLTESLGTIQSRALNGDSHYQGALALFHKFGERGLAIDLQEAERWAKLAAEKEGALDCVPLPRSLLKVENKSGSLPL